MAVNSITTGNMSVFQAQSLNAVASSDKQATGMLSSNDNQSNKAALTTPLEAITVKNKISAPEKQTPKKTPLENNANRTTKPSGVTSHVVVTYNPQGKIRTKFLDSRNNVVYQVPPEMLAKMEDLMMKPETSTNIKG